MDLDRHEWLAQRVEPAIDPDQRIVDPHHHLWDRGGSTYLASELLADVTGSHNVVKTVFVECKSNYNRDVAKHLAPVGETVFVAGEVDRCDELGGPTIAGIVSYADMMLGAAVEEVLDAHVLAGGGRFRGIRHATAWHQSDEIHNSHVRPFEAMMTSDSFVAGVETLGSMGFSFDAWLYFAQIDELTSLAKRCPGTTIILDHLGGPLAIGEYALAAEQAHGAWQASMQSIAKQPNVVLKVGGIGMDNYFNTGWGAQATPPGSEEVATYWNDDVHWCIDLFGPDRCMFESNFPVDRQTLPYAVLWNALQILAARYTPEEQQHLFAGTAERVYNV